MRKERREVQSRGEAGEKTQGGAAGCGQGSMLLSSLGKPEQVWGTLGLESPGPPCGEEPELMLLCFCSFQGTRICNVCSAASDSLPFEERNGRFGARPFCQRTEGRCSLIFADSVPLLHSEVQAWPAQRGHFRGEFVYFKPRTASWVRFLHDDFVFCI